MENYIVNCSIDGIDKREIDSLDLVTGRDKNIIIVINSDTNDKLKAYYNKIIEIILSGNKPIVIGIDGESNIEKAIFTLMCSYRCYNIYKVYSVGSIDLEYIEDVISRNPSFEEVQTFVGADITAYSEINNIILTVEKLVENKDIDGLSDLIEKNMSTICRFTDVIEYMKVLIDNSNNSNLELQIDKLNELLIKAKKEINDTIRELDNAKEINKNLEDKYSDVAKNYDILKSELEDIKSQEPGAMPIMRNYATINTSTIKCKTKIVVYFKEISKVPYINSLVSYFMNYLQLKKFSVKLLVYDNQCTLNSCYYPLTVVSGNEYMANKDRITSKIDKVVVVEPNPIIITEVLTLLQDSYDIVIVYDRLGQANDIVSGNNVYKIYVANSASDVKNTEKMLKITDSAMVITREGSSLLGLKNTNRDIVDIKRVDGFAIATDTAKYSKYIQLKTSKGKPVINSIIAYTKINSLGVK